MKHLKIILIIILLSGCTTTDIRYQIDDKHTVTYTIEAFIDLQPLDTDLKEALITLAMQVDQDYQSRGFETHTKITDTSILLNYEQSKSNPDLESAYRTLKMMMSDFSKSIFLNVELTNEVQETLGAFQLYASSDLDTYLQATDLKQLPPTLEEEITSHLQQGVINVDFVLPKADIITANDDVEVKQGEYTTTISATMTLDKALEIDVKGIHVIQNGKVINQNLQSSLEKSKSDIEVFRNLQFVALLIAGLSLVVFMLRSIFRKVI